MIRKLPTRLPPLLYGAVSLQGVALPSQQRGCGCWFLSDVFYVTSACIFLEFSWLLPPRVWCGMWWDEYARMLCVAKTKQTKDERKKGIEPCMPYTYLETQSEASIAYMCMLYVCVIFFWCVHIVALWVGDSLCVWAQTCARHFQFSSVTEPRSSGWLAVFRRSFSFSLS